MRTLIGLTIAAGLFLFAGIPNRAMARDVPKKELVALFPNFVERTCSEKRPVHKCLRVSKSECLVRVRKAEKSCFKDYQDKIPVKLQPSEQTAWTIKLGVCVWASIQKKKTLDTACIKREVAKAKRKGSSF